MFRLPRYTTILLAAASSGGAGGTNNNGDGGKINNKKDEVDAVSSPPSSFENESNSSTPPSTSSSSSSSTPQQSSPKMPAIVSSVEEQPLASLLTRRPYEEYSGERHRVPQTVSMGSVGRAAPGSVMRPSSVSSAEKPRWMSNIDRKWETVSPEFGKSTIDTRREWFRVMQYNCMVDKWEIPDSVVVRNRKFKHWDAYDEWCKKNPDTHRAQQTMELRKEQEQAEFDAREEAKVKAQKIMEEYQYEKDASVGKIQPTSPAHPLFKKTHLVGSSGTVLPHKMDRGEDAPWQTTPVANVEITNPIEGSEFWHLRGARIAEEIVHYDPDILCLNELNKSHFNESMWCALRSQGYGSLFVSSRSQEGRRPILRNHEVPIPYHGDIGNAIFYHKGRFFPMWMAGSETNKSIPYLHFVGLRDRIMNMCVWLCCVQLTAGDDLKAIRAREQEARGVVMAIKRIVEQGDEANTSGVMIVGDLNNVYADEPCVGVLRDKYRSAYDAVGGSRWTSWYKRDKELPFGSQRHLEADWSERNEHKKVLESKETLDKVRQLMQDRAERGGATATAARFLAESATAGNKSSATTTTEQGGDGNKKQKDSADVAAATSGDDSAVVALEKQIKKSDTTAPGSLQETSSQLQTTLAMTTHELPLPDQSDDIALIAREKLGVVKTASDFVMYEDRVFSVLRVLDVPPDDAVLPRLTFDEEQAIIEEVEAEFEEKRKQQQQDGEGTSSTTTDPNFLKRKSQAVAQARHLAREFYRPGVALLPNEQFPSHHIPLVCDMCWNRWSYAHPSAENPLDAK